uniref:testis-specific expressed protein 55 n=1 Tax=Jaculus jaculus TaxID=51337 RepID=UPI001E1B2F95|nr:testis-specific expressed protein 55 [Jaculus jaculus]
MDEPVEEAAAGSLEAENTVSSPPADQIHKRENDKQEKQEEEDDQASDRIAGQSDQNESGQDEAFTVSEDDPKIPEHAVPETYDQADLQSSEQTDNNMSSQADSSGHGQTDQIIYEETEQNLSSPDERRASQNVNHRLSGQVDRRTSQQTDRRSSGLVDRRTSQQRDRRSSGQVDRRTSQQTDRRSSGQVDRRTSESPDFQLPSLTETISSGKIDEVPSDGRGSGQIDQGAPTPAEKIASQTDNKLPVLSDQGTSQQSEEQATYQDRIYDHEDENQAHLLGSREIDQKDFRSYYKTLRQAEDRLIPDRKDDIGDDDRIEPCTFSDSQTDLKPKLSAQETESSPTIQLYNTGDIKPTNNVQAKERPSYEKLPTISTKVYYTSSMEKIHVPEIIPDDIFEAEEGMSSKRYSLTYRKRFPSIVYEDPYQVALKYMEEHNILQIFQQITENLVYEQPRDPLSSMLRQEFNVCLFAREHAHEIGPRCAYCSSLLTLASSALRRSLVTSEMRTRLVIQKRRSQKWSHAAVQPTTGQPLLFTAVSINSVSAASENQRCSQLSVNSVSAASGKNGFRRTKRIRACYDRLTQAESICTRRKRMPRRHVQ